MSISHGYDSILPGPLMLLQAHHRPFGLCLPSEPHPPGHRDGSRDGTLTYGLLVTRSPQTPQS